MTQLFAKKNCLLIFFCFFAILDCDAGVQDSVSISVVYRKGEYITTTILKVNASPTTMNAVIDDFLYQTKYNLDALFTWGLVGLKLRKENDDLLIFNFKSTEYDKKNDLIKAIGEVVVPGIITFPEIHVNSRMTKKLLPNDNTEVNFEILYSDAFLKKTTALFKMVPIDSKSCTISLETKVRFGWFFDFFISQSLFRQIMAWRYAGLLKNLGNEAVLRETNKNRTYERKVQQKSR